MTNGHVTDEFSRRTIAARCETALQHADALGNFPTPMDRVLNVAGADEVVDIGAIPSTISVAKPKLLKRLLGAVLYKEATVFVDLNQGNGRVLWTKGHEATHLILPWHDAAAHLDDKQRLFGDSAEQLEIEANHGAAHLIFQGHRGMQEALDYRHGLAAPLLLAKRTDASIHATIRYYVENHPDPMALATTGRRLEAGRLPVYLCASSPAWEQRFADPSLIFGQRLNAGSGTFAELLTSPTNGDDVKITNNRLRDLRGDLQPIAIGAFDNRYNKFFLIRTRRRVELGRRIRATTH